MAIHPGDTLAGYRVTRLLGRGGMGEVWAAHRARPRDGGGDQQEVAIKVLLQRAAMKPDLVKRFEREARIASAIKSPFVCKLIQVDRTDDGSHVLVFELLNGESLADRLKREQFLPLSEVGPIIDDVLQGLNAAHVAGVIHRDLKPGNIFLEHIGLPDRPERAKVLDFGISKLTGSGEKEEPTLTAFDATLGSFAYMAPEQVRGAARADERADVYAVGAVAFRALAGRLPFEGSTAAVLVSLKLDRSAPSLAEATGEKWPSGVERFLEKALERRREKRFRTASEALAAWRAIQPANITRRTSLPPPRPPMPSETGSFLVEDHPTEVDGPPTMTLAGTDLGGSFAGLSADDSPMPRAPARVPTSSPPKASRPAPMQSPDPSGIPRPPASRSGSGRGAPPPPDKTTRQRRKTGRT